MGRLLIASLQERLSRLEELMEKLEALNFLLEKGIAYLEELIGSFLGRRLCDGAVYLKDMEGEAMNLVSPYFQLVPWNGVHCLDEMGHRYGGFGVDDETGSFRVELLDEEGEATVLEVDRRTLRAPAALERVEAVGLLGVDAQGRIGLPLSSRSAKENPQPLDGALDMVMRVEPVRFRWRDSGREDVGFIDEELRGKIGIGIHEMIALVAVLWGAVRELAEEVRSGGQGAGEENGRT